MKTIKISDEMYSSLMELSKEINGQDHRATQMPYLFQVQTKEGRLKVGDEILAVVVAGDIRENVFPALIKTVNRIKADASKKKETLSKRRPK